MSTSVAPAQRRQYRCGVCGVVGHNRSTCPQNGQQQASRRPAQQVARQQQILISQQQQVARRQQQVSRQQQAAAVETIIEPTATEPIEAEDCPICMEKLGKTNCCTTGCGHQYCLNCFVKHVGTKDTCPLCRQKVPSNKKKSSSRSSLFAAPVRPTPRPNPNAFDITIENTSDLTIRLDWLPINREPVRLQNNITPLSSRTQRVGNRGDRFCIIIDNNPFDTNFYIFTANNAGETFIFTGDSVISYN